MPTGSNSTRVRSIVITAAKKQIQIKHTSLNCQAGYSYLQAFCYSRTRGELEKREVSK